MPLVLHYHPLSSYCHKALVALYEAEVSFETQLVNLGDEASGSALRALWPQAKMPVLRDEERGHTVAEVSVIIEYLDAHYAGPNRFIPADSDEAWQVRMWDRVCDLYLHEPMQKVVIDNLRPEGQGDQHGVEEARERIAVTYAMLEDRMATRTWMVGEAFTLADCAASPALFYGNAVQPIGRELPNLRAYHSRLMDRPAFARVLTEAEPYFHMVPIAQKPTLRKPGEEDRTGG